MIGNRWWIWSMILLRINWTMTLMVSSMAIHATPAYGFQAMGLGRWGAVAAGMFSVACAIVAMNLKGERLLGLILLLAPQLQLAWLSALGSLNCIRAGAYADGTVIAKGHMYYDQSIYILIAVLYTFAWLHLFVIELPRRIREW